MYECVCLLLSHVQLFVTPWTVACQAPLSMEFSRQGYWNGLPFPSPGDLPDPGMEPMSPALQADSLLSEPLRKPKGPPLRCYNPNKNISGDLLVVQWLGVRLPTQGVQVQSPGELGSHTYFFFLKAQEPEARNRTNIITNTVNLKVVHIKKRRNLNFTKVSVFFSPSILPTFPKKQSGNQTEIGKIPVIQNAPHGPASNSRNSTN